MPSAFSVDLTFRGFVYLFDLYQENSWSCPDSESTFPYKEHPLEGDRNQPFSVFFPSSILSLILKSLNYNLKYLIA